MNPLLLRIIDSPADMAAVEELQRQVWPGDDTEVVPGHLLLTAVHNGGLLVGAYDSGEPPAGDSTGDAGDARDRLPEAARLVGFVFGFPGLYDTPDGPRPKHCSHMLGVLPGYRDRGAGFLLKRAQWQMVRHQGLDRVTWTYDPLLSRNAHLNIARLGAVCSTYLRNAYGDLHDSLNAGLPTDRFQLDWWINSPRVVTRLSRRARKPLDLAHYLSAGTRIINATQLDAGRLPRPPQSPVERILSEIPPGEDSPEQPLLLAEIPANFSAIRRTDHALAVAWRRHTRELFEALFAQGYLATDFIYLPGADPRSFYVFSHGDAVLPGVKKS
ncbi:MAG: hypothetical protein ACKOC5_19405 [Chloroflexota bacterium]